MLVLGQIDRTSDSPPYRQIASILRSAIVSGQLQAGDRIASEAKLIEHFGVARMTVRHAIQELRFEELVVAEHGRGVFVRSVAASGEHLQQEPGMPAEARIVVQAQDIRTRMCTLSSQVSGVESIGDSAVVSRLISDLASVSLAQADILGKLAVRLRGPLASREDMDKLFSTFEIASRASADASRACQLAAESIRSSA